jgi:hypothetical protein
VDALDVLDVGAEVGRMIDLVLEEDARNFVWGNLAWLNRVVGGVEEVVLERARGDCELQVSACFEVGIADCAAPELEGIGRHGIFGGGFFVLAVGGLV